MALPQSNFNLDTRVAPSPNGGTWRLFLFFFSILMLLVLGYVGLLFGYKPYLKREIAAREQSLADLAAQVSQTEQEDFLSFYFQLVDIKNLLSSHVMTSRLLGLLQARISPGVYFSNLTFNTFEGKATIEAFADSYDSFTEQLQAFATTPDIASYAVSNAVQDKGLVKFQAILTMKPEAYKNKN